MVNHLAWFPVDLHYLTREQRLELSNITFGKSPGQRLLTQHAAAGEACAETHHQPPRRHPLDGRNRRCSGHHVAEIRDKNGRAEANAAGSFGHQAHDHPNVFPD